MAKQTFTSGQVLTSAQMTTLQQNDWNMSTSVQTGNYTFVAADAGTREIANSATAITFTVPNNIFTAGDTVAIHNINSGLLTVAAGTGVTLNALSTSIVQWQGATLYATSTSSFILFPTGGAVKTTKVTAFTASGTFTPPTGVTYAIAYMKGGGGGIGRSSVGGAGGTSSVAFAGGTVSAVGGPGVAVGHGSPDGTFGYSPQANSGLGAYLSLDEQGLAGGNTGQAFEGAYIVAGGTVTPGVGITVTVGAGGTAGATSGFAGGSGYVWIEFAE